MVAGECVADRIAIPVGGDDAADNSAGRHVLVKGEGRRSLAPGDRLVEIGQTDGNRLAGCQRRATGTGGAGDDGQIDAITERLVIEPRRIGENDSVAVDCEEVGMGARQRQGDSITVLVRYID